MRELENRIEKIASLLECLTEFAKNSEFNRLDKFVNHLTQEVQGIKKDSEKRYYNLEGMIDDIRDDIPDDYLTDYDLDDYAEQHEVDKLEDRVDDLEKRISDLE